MDTTKIFDKEGKIKAIGGKLCDDYYRFREIVLEMNAILFPFLADLGFVEGDTQIVIDAIIKGEYKKAFVDNITSKVEKGDIEIDKILSTHSMRKAASTPDEKEKQLKKSLRTCLYTKYTNIIKGNRCIIDLRFNKNIVKICRNALYYYPSGFVIDVEKFIELYTDYLKSDESLTKRQHQAAADSINKFFNGLEITEEELERYFVIENGVVRVNIESINGLSYARLGTRKAKNRRR